MLKRWERDFLRNEFVLWTVAAILLALWALDGGGATLDDLIAGNRAVLYGSLASVSGALLGFLVATITILQGIVGGTGFRRLRSSDQYPTLWRTFRLTIRALAVLCGMSLLSLLLDSDHSPRRPFLLLTVWAFLVAADFLGRSIWILERLLEIAGKQET